VRTLWGVSCFLFVCLFCGCETTGDPNSSGVYNFSTRKAKQRVGKLETQLAQERAAHEATRGRIRSLKEIRAQKAQEERRLTADLAKLQEDLVQLKIQVQNLSVDNAYWEEWILDFETKWNRIAKRDGSMATKDRIMQRLDMEIEMQDAHRELGLDEGLPILPE